MALNLSWLRACKISHLKAIATAIGVNSSGTKPLLTSQLLQHLPCGYFNDDDTTKCIHNDKYDIVSIDMGIRNLAFCRLTFAQPPRLVKPGSSWNGTPVITDWARIEISKSASRTKVIEEAKAKEAFDPATYSQHAYNLVTSLLSSTSHHTTHILIERQRFRSMGGSAVQEWTLRVNMFEAMIYAVLKTLSEAGTWQGKVYPVAPAKVSKFWLGDKEGAGTIDGAGSKRAKTKRAKVELVGRWLEERKGRNPPFRLEGKVEDLAKAYLKRWRDGKRIGARKKTDKSSRDDVVPSEIGKLDDLADCLLQAMAWIKWEQNRRSFMCKGIEALDEVG